MMNTISISSQPACTVKTAPSTTSEINVLVRQCFVGFDTNIFMHDSARLFFDELKRALTAERRQCFTIQEVYQELQRLSQSEDAAKAQKARTGLAILHELHKAGLIVVYEAAPVKKEFADAAWLSLLSQMRTRFTLALLTQDAALARDVVERVNGQESVHAAPVKVRRINAAGHLSYFRLGATDDGHIIVLPHSSIKNRSIPDDFRLPPVSVDEGDVLCGLNRTPYTLEEEFACGGEGVVWKVKEHPELLIKVFNTPTNSKFQKVKLLCNKDVISGAVLPKDVLFTADGSFAGYLMERVNGVSVESVFTLRGQKKHCPDWTRRDFAVLASSIAALCDRLFTHGVLPGDINPSNFLIARDSEGKLDPNAVWAIDLDSAQVTDRAVIYPSEGYTPQYCAPELLREGGPKANALRNKESFFYSVSLLCLQCILCGVHAFRLCSDDPEATVIDAMKSETLPYGTSEARRAGVAPSGIEKLWSNMPLSTKRFFSSILQKGGERNALEKRPSPYEIAKELSSYVLWLDDEANRRRFPEILSLNPQCLKPYYAVCANKQCGREFIVEKPNSSGKYYCPECTDRWHNGVSHYKVGTCGHVFAVKNFEKRNEPTLCVACRAKVSSAAVYGCDTLLPDQNPAAAAASPAANQATETANTAAASTNPAAYQAAETVNTATASTNPTAYQAAATVNTATASTNPAAYQATGTVNQTASTTKPAPTAASGAASINPTAETAGPAAAVHPASKPANKLPEALKAYVDTIRYLEEQDAAGLLTHRNALATVYAYVAGLLDEQHHMTAEALEMYNKAANIREALDSAGQLADRNSLAELYEKMRFLFAKQQDVDSVLEMHNKAQKIRQELKPAEPDGFWATLRKKLAL